MKMHRSLPVGLLNAVLVLAALAQQPQAEAPLGEEYMKANYTKYEHRIRMRDGVRLFTSVYVPKDRSKDHPILMTRTPYSVGPYGVDRYRASLGPNDLFAKDGYIFVYQDVRGRYMSEGEFVNVRPHLPEKSGPSDIDESTDTWDSIDWLVKHVPHNNGKVGIWGISYPGFYAAAGAIDAHPALKAASPQAPVTDWFIGDDFHHNGAFYLTHAFRFFYLFGKPRPEPTTDSTPPFDFKTPDGYKFYLEAGPLVNFDEKYLKGEVAFWKDLMEHGTYDEFWKARAIQNHLKAMRPAMMTVGGWFDAEDLFGPLKVYESIGKSSPGGTNLLVMGPWYHGQWSRDDGERLGHVPFNSKTGVFYREQIELPFFQHHLKDAPDPKLPEALVFETGRNQWRRLNEWPPREARPRSLYLGENGGLRFDAPPEAAAGYDEYISDPNKPVPYIPNVAPTMTREHMVDDQRFAASRTDVLVYQSEVLEEDVTLVGNFTASLWVSTTGTDSDWVVKLIDVYPDNFPDPDPNPTGVRMGGYQQLVRGEAMRGKFRNSFEKAEPFRPGEVSKVEYELPGAYHTFRSGHRIMVQIQSSWFPLIDRNPQEFVDIYKARRDDFQKATQRVYRTRTQPSHLKVLVLETEPR